MRTRGQGLLVMDDTIGAPVNPPKFDSTNSSLLTRWGQKKAAIANFLASNNFTVETKRSKSNRYIEF